MSQSVPLACHGMYMFLHFNNCMYHWHILHHDGHGTDSDMSESVHVYGRWSGFQMDSEPSPSLSDSEAKLQFRSRFKSCHGNTFKLTVTGVTQVEFQVQRRAFKFEIRSLARHDDVTGSKTRRPRRAADEGQLQHRDQRASATSCQ
jgi:hypothetical protein